MAMTLGNTVTVKGQMASGSLRGTLRIPVALGETYEGEVEVIPSDATQTLNTKFKTLTCDITVNAIPYAEVSNVYGGKTITIGG